MDTDITRVPLRIAHLGSIHCGSLLFDESLMRTTVSRVNALEPDIVVVAGDLTMAGYEWEYAQAVAWLDQFEAPKVVVPGNHDSRNVGYVHFEHHFGDRVTRYRQAFDDERAERLDATGLTIVGVDSSEPDLDEGHIGREWYAWIRDQFDEEGDIKLFVIHHHLVSVPGAGRELNVITDAGDLLPMLTGLGVDITLSGHKHVPYFWGLNGMLVANSGTATTREVRGSIPPSWNEIRVDASTIKVYLHYGDGRRELSVIRSRPRQARIREAFHLTDDFLDANHVLST